jgi:hypothetical protein
MKVLLYTVFKELAAARVVARRLVYICTLRRLAPNDPPAIFRPPLDNKRVETTRQALGKWLRGESNVVTSNLLRGPFPQS